LVVFEAASMLLLIAAVGAIVLAGRRKGDDDRPASDPDIPGRIPASPGSPVADAPSEEMSGISSGAA
jgi:hypothetical protein